MPSVAPQPRMLPEQATAVRRAVLVPAQLTDWVPQACAEVATCLFRRGIPPSGYPFARSRPVHDDLIEVEAGFPVAAPIAGSGRVRPSTLPAGPVVVGRHKGAHEQIGPARQAIDDWLQTEGADRDGDSWEIYHDLPTCDDLGGRIEVVQPITFSAADV
ncbi:GyrI-like domain-containing protein [Kribbella sp. CWNU-51]